MIMRRLFVPLFIGSICAFIVIHLHISVRLRTVNHHCNLVDECCYHLPDALRQQWRHQASSTGRQIQSFQRVASGNDSDSVTDHVFSAYLDDRPMRDLVFNGGKKLQLPVVRVLSVLKRGRNNWRCFYLSETFDLLYSVPVASWTDLDKLDATLPTVTAMLLCPVIANRQLRENSKQSLIPSFVSIGSSCNCSVVENLLRVVNSPQRRRRLQQTGNDSRIDNRVVEFAVCVPVLFSQNYLKPGDLIEFIEVNRLFGVELFFFHVEPKALTEWLTTCLERYRRIGVVEWIPWTVPKEIASKTHYHGQITVINDCIYRSMYRTLYLVNQDFDEFIVPTAAENWHQLIERMNERQSRVNATPVAFSFRNQFHFVPPPVNNGSPDSFLKLANLNSYRTLSVKEVDGKIWPHRERAKIMLRPDVFLRTYVHVVFEEDFVQPKNTTAALKLLNVEQTDAVLYHFRFRSKSVGKTSPDARLRHFVPEISRRLVNGLEFCFKGDARSNLSYLHQTTLT